MAKGTKLTEFEKGQIVTLHAQNKSNRWIATQIGRSETVVRGFLKSPQQYGTKKSPGRPKILKKRDIRRLNREASKGKLCARELKNKLELNVNIRRVRQVLIPTPIWCIKSAMGSQS